MNEEAGKKSPATPTGSPTIARKRHKPLVVKKVPASEVAPSQTTAGYMERKGFNAQWIRYWYILHEGTLFCYLTPDDNVTVDVLNLHGYSVTSLVDKFRGKRFVLQLSHENFTSLYLSMESREEMDTWQQCLETALKQPSSRAREEADDDSEQGACAGCESNRREDMGERRKQVKQKLLEEMLRQKHELERKQAERHKKQKTKDPDSPDRSPNSSYLNDFMTEDQRTSDVTRLRQRRMSTQLKVETIQKQIVKPSQAKRGIFHFGKSKKLDENKNVFLQDQLKELNEKLQKIDTDLNQVEHDKATTLDMLDMNQNKKRVSSSTTLAVEGSDTGDRTVENDEDKRANGIKSTMQKWTNKTFNKSSTKRKQNQSQQNTNLSHTGSVPNLNSVKANGDLVNGVDCVDHGGSDTASEDLLSSMDNSVTDLTRPTADLRLDLNVSYNGSTGSGSPRYARSNSRSSTVSTLSSPRREINPSVMAEIDAFEELTRQVLGARSKELPTK